MPDQLRGIALCTKVLTLLSLRSDRTASPADRLPATPAGILSSLYKNSISLQKYYHIVYAVHNP